MTTNKKRQLHNNYDATQEIGNNCSLKIKVMSTWEEEEKEINFLGDKREMLKEKRKQICEKFVSRRKKKKRRHLIRIYYVSHYYTVLTGWLLS